MAAKVSLRSPSAAGICHRPVALDIADDPAERVPDLQAPPVARIVDVPEVLAALGVVSGIKRRKSAVPGRRGRASGARILGSGPFTGAKVLYVGP